MTPLAYCSSRFRAVRRLTREVKVGEVGVGGNNPLRLQSMTTANTLDVEATARQTIELAEAGCEIVRITAPNVRAAEALGPIAKKVRAAGITAPLVADVHFLPQAAMEAAKHVEKVRVNPGNYADRKKFATREYSDSEYDAELERLHEAFSPLVLRCRELGRSMRVGTNHGSLSDRILNRYGDTPRGMAESALEFVRIAESHGYRDVILSMKASNPKVMVEAYRLVVALMNEEGMDHPLHLGVTEAGDGEDARIKSAVGIGTLLLDGLGDTIRVSLTEDPVHEIPVARDLAARAEGLWAAASEEADDAEPHDAEIPHEGIDPYAYARRECLELNLGHACKLGPKEPPRVIVPAGKPLAACPEIVSDLARIQTTNKDAPVEGLLLRLEDDAELPHLATLRQTLAGALPFLVIEDLRGTATPLPTNALAPNSSSSSSSSLALDKNEVGETAGQAGPRSEERGHVTPPTTSTPTPLQSPPLSASPALLVLRAFSAEAENVAEALPAFLAQTTEAGHRPALALNPEDVNAGLLDPFAATSPPGPHSKECSYVKASAPVVTLRALASFSHPTAGYRALAAALRDRKLPLPLWIRSTDETRLQPKEDLFSARLLDASILTGSLLCDGLGDLLSVENAPDPERARALAYNLLQGARARISKTEFVACPSCGRTLFDLQTTTQRVKESTDHLKGVTIAVMGCIVNGPGEMADADFGYVGAAPGKIDLYVGKDRVKSAIPEAEAVDRLVQLIQEEGKWIQP